MPKLYLSAVLLFLVLPAIGQGPLLKWAKVFEAYSTTNSNGRTVGVDGLGNVYSAGLFENSFDFDPGPGIFMMTGGSRSRYGIYISKLDVNGNFVWAKQIPVLVEFGNIELKVDKTGNIYLASNITETADMDPGPGVFMMTPIGPKSAFIVKLNGNGDLIWAKQFGGPGDTVPHANALEVDQDNNVYICGGFNNTVDFDPGPGTFNLTSSAHIQSYIVKLDNNGELIWAKQFGNSPVVYGGCGINDIKCDKRGDIIVIGSFGRTCDFDPGPGVYNVTSSPGSAGDGFICKLDANCNFIWVKTIGQNGSNNHYIIPRGIDVDGMNNIVTAGSFLGNFDFDPGAGVQISYSNPTDCYILKLDQQGTFLWVKIIGAATESDSGNDVVVDAANNVYTIGSFGTSVDFDPGPGVFTISSPYYGAEALVKLTSNGDFLYAAPFQSINYGTSLFRRMDIDPNRNIYVAGSVSGTVDFDPGQQVYPLIGASNSAPFVLKLAPCLNSTSSMLTISECNSYTLNNQTYSASGTFLQTLQNAAGCDSIITLNLTINKKLTEQTKIICNGEFFFAGGINQNKAGTYIDTLQTVMGCDSIVTTYLKVNPTPAVDIGIDKNLCKNTQLTLTPGNFTSYLWQDNSTAAVFTADKAGTYWVRVTNSFNCIATDTFKVAAIIELPSNFLRQTDSVCSYKSLELAPFQSYSDYKWFNGTTEKKIEVQRPGIYWLKVTDANGCTGIDTTIVFAKQCMFGVYIPTGFTPDNNGKNDIFKPQVFGKLLQYRLTVYNRWGNIVFQSTDHQKGWDGRIAGILQGNSVFVWTCTYQLEGGDTQNEKGTLMLVR